MEKLFEDISLMGETILGIEQGEYRWYLNSRYSAADIAREFVENMSVKNMYSNIFIFGYANGMYIDEIRKKYPYNVIVCFEPNEEICKRYEDRIDAYEKNDEKIVVASTLEEFAQVVANTVGEINKDYISFAISPNYDKIYPIECKSMQYELEKAKLNNIMTQNTSLLWDNMIGGNRLRVLIDAISQNIIADLKQMKDIVGERPALVVSAGPSLDKNISLIKRIKNKALIVATDAAILALDKQGIVPDIIVTIDAKKNPKLFDAQVINDIPMICVDTSNYKVFETANVRRFYITNQLGYMAKFLETEDEETIGTGANVASTAFLAAKFMGAKKIILIGQDLAFEGNKEHTESADAVCGRVIKEKKVDGLVNFMVDGNLEDKVLTNVSLNSYRAWFEFAIMSNPDIEVINITAGGAKIKGAKFMAGEEYIKKELDPLHEVDFLAALRKIEKRYEPSVIEQKMGVIRDLKYKMEDISEYIRKLRNKYREFDKINLETKGNSPKLSKIGKQILEMQEEMQKMPEFEFLYYYNIKEEVEIQKDVLEVCDNIYDEYKVIYEKGVKLLNMYEDCVDLFMEDYNEIVLGM